MQSKIPLNLVDENENEIDHTKDITNDRNIKLK